MNKLLLVLYIDNINYLKINVIKLEQKLIVSAHKQDPIEFNKTIE